MINTLYGYKLLDLDNPHDLTVIAWEGGFFIIQFQTPDEIANRVTRKSLENAFPYVFKKDSSLSIDEFNVVFILGLTIPDLMTFELGPTYQDEIALERVIALEREILSNQRNQLNPLHSPSDSIKNTSKISRQPVNTQKKIAQTIPASVIRAREVILGLHDSGVIFLPNVNRYWMETELYFGPLKITLKLDSKSRILAFTAVIGRIKDTYKIEEIISNIPIVPLTLEYNLEPNPQVHFTIEFPLFDDFSEHQLFQFMRQGAASALVLLVSMISEDMVVEPDKKILKSFELHKGQTYFEAPYLYDELFIPIKS